MFLWCKRRLQIHLFIIHFNALLLAILFGALLLFAAKYFSPYFRLSDITVALNFSYPSSSMAVLKLFGNVSHCVLRQPRPCDALIFIIITKCTSLKGVLKAFEGFQKAFV